VRVQVSQIRFEKFCGGYSNPAHFQIVVGLFTTMDNKQLQNSFNKLASNVNALMTEVEALKSKYTSLENNLQNSSSSEEMTAAQVKAVFTALENDEETDGVGFADILRCMEGGSDLLRLRYYYYYF
jgi:hypothetical protein